MIKSLIHSMIVCPDMTKDYPKIAYGKGSYLYDTHGKAYLDAAGGSAAVSNIGYGIPAVAEAMRAQAEKVSVLPAHCASAEIVEAYLEQLAAFAPEGFDRAWTVGSGSEAVENAVKLSLQHFQLKGKPTMHKILSRWHTYHGNSVFTLDIGGMKMRRSTYNQWLHNFPHIPAAYAYRRPEGMSVAAYSHACSQALEEAIIEAGPDTVAAFVVEPVVAAALGAVPPPDAHYFHAIRKICDKYDVLLIADEVLTGFGRIGTNFGMDKFGVKPDIIATGKGISGGYLPLSAVIASNAVMEPFIATKTAFLGGHTFACYPLGAAVGQFVLDYIKRERLLENAQKMGALLKERLMALRDHEAIGDVRGEGLMLGVELVQDKDTKKPFPKAMGISKLVGEKSIEKGVILYPGKGSVDGVQGDHIMITPPLSINETEVDKIASVLEESLTEVVSYAMA